MNDNTVLSPSEIIHIIMDSNEHWMQIRDLACKRLSRKTLYRRLSESLFHLNMLINLRHKLVINQAQLIEIYTSLHIDDYEMRLFDDWFYKSVAILITQNPSKKRNWEKLASVIELKPAAEALLFCILLLNRNLAIIRAVLADIRDRALSLRHLGKELEALPYALDLAEQFFRENAPLFEVGEPGQLR